MAKFMLVRFSVMAEIIDAGELREAALKNFDADMTSDDYPGAGGWHASEEGQQERRQIATQDRDALTSWLTRPRPAGCLTACPVPRPEA